MKKLLLTAMLALATVAGASAQSTIFNNPDNEPYFGVRAMYNLKCPGKMKIDDAGKYQVLGKGSGFGIGVIYNVPMFANLYIEPGLTFYYNTESIKPGMMAAIVDSEGEPYDVKHASMRKFGMRIPLMFGYHFDFTPDIKVSVYTGPELDLGFSNDQYMTVDFPDGQAHAAPSAYGDNAIIAMHRWNCNWKFGAGISYDNYYLGIGGGIGVFNMSDIDYTTMYENYFEVSLGYNF